MPNVAVIGGGCAGLAAASRLAEHHVPVTLFEAGRQLGGRARSISWKGQTLDNGQHILLGAYSETLRQIRLSGVTEQDCFLRLPLQLIMQDAFKLSACPMLPAPLHILLAMLTAQGLSSGERLAAVRFMLWLRLKKFRLPADLPLGQFLSARRQPVRLVKLLWEPLCLAALNTPLNRASAQVFLNVLRDSFAGAKADSDLLLPKTDLSNLIAQPLADYIEHHGGQVRTNAMISDVRKAGTGFCLGDADGTEHAFSHVVLAISPFRLVDLIQGIPALGDTSRQVAQFAYQPIYTIYLQFPAHVTLPSPMTGLADAVCQWVFDRGVLYGQHGLLAVVISAEGEHQKLTQHDLGILVQEELQHAFPGLPQALWFKIIAEKRATFACTAGLDRPGYTTALPNLYIAGDYVAGDYPATIEGAMRSGRQCAEAIISSQHQEHLR